MHYYSVFKDRSPLGAIVNVIARCERCQSQVRSIRENFRDAASANAANNATCGSPALAPAATERDPGPIWPNRTRHKVVLPLIRGFPLKIRVLRRCARSRTFTLSGPSR